MANSTIRQLEALEAREAALRAKVEERHQLAWDTFWIPFSTPEVELITIAYHGPEAIEADSPEAGWRQMSPDQRAAFLHLGREVAAWFTRMRQAITAGEVVVEAAGPRRFTWRAPDLEHLAWWIDDAIPRVHDVEPPARTREAMLAWLDAAHASESDGITRLEALRLELGDNSPVEAARPEVSPEAPTGAAAHERNAAGRFL